MSDDDSEATHCFSYQGNKIYVVIDDETTEVDLLEALMDNWRLQSPPRVFKESKYDTFLSMKFIVEHRDCLSLEYGNIEAFMEADNLDVAYESKLEDIFASARDSSTSVREKNNSMRKLSILGRTDSVCPRLVQLGVIPVIVSFMDSGNLDLQVAACGLVLNLAYEDEIKEQLVDHGIVPKLASLVMSDVTALHRSAAGAIRNIACDNEDIIEEISSFSNVLPRLIELLESPLLDVKAVAAAALRNLAAKESLRQTIAKMGALNSLMQLIQVQNEEVQRGAAGCLAYLAEDRTIRDQISRQDAVSALLPLLMMNTTDDQLLANTARAIAKLALDDTNCLEIGKKGGIPVFVKLLNSTSPEVLRWACNAIYNLAVHDINSRLLGNTNAIPIIIGLLSHGDIEVRKNAIGALWNLSARDENAAKIVQEKGAPTVVAMLDSDNLEIIRRALPTIGNIARQEPLRETLASLGAARSALRWLQTSHEEILDGAAFVLQGLASLESTSQEVLNAKAIELILTVMKTAKPNIFLALGNALLALSYFDDQKLAIAQAGGVEILVNLFKNPSDLEVQTTVPPILGSLAFNDAICAEITEKGAIPLLIDNLKSSNKKLCYAAIDAISNLSAEESTRASLIQHSCLEPLLANLNVKSNITLEGLLRTLLNLASDEVHIPILIECGVITKLKPFLKSTDREIKKNTISALRNLSSLETAVESFINEEAVGCFVEFIQGNITDHDLLIPAFATLVNLSASDSVPSLLTQTVDAISTFTSFLSSNNQEISVFCIIIIFNVARNPDTVYSISKKALQTLLDLTLTSNVEGQTQAAAALHYLAQQESNKLEICNSEKFVNLIELLETNDERSRNAGWTLEQLVSNGQCATLIVQKSTVPRLVKYLSSSNEDVKNAILFVLYKALRADMKLRVDLKEAGAIDPLQQQSNSTDKRIASFANYMFQVLNQKSK